MSNKLPEHTLLVSLFELPALVNNIAITSLDIGKTSEDEKHNFEQMELLRRQAAKQEKLDVLARLKQQDQNIPISFYADGEPTHD